jgi:tRNA A37 N6-isopentenylltransferase MiaA
MTPLESDARRLIRAMEGVDLSGKPDAELAEIIEAHQALSMRLFHIERLRNQRQARAARKVQP